MLSIKENSSPDDNDDVMTVTIMIEFIKKVC